MLGSSSSNLYLGMSGGGSGYVYTSETLLDTPEQPQPNARFYLTNTQMIDGDSTMPTPLTPSSTEIGHSGDGYARITLILE